MVDVAQMVEHSVVIRKVVGSNPTIHPNKSAPMQGGLTAIALRPQIATSSDLGSSPSSSTSLQIHAIRR
jgi:hypothetical protein